VRGGARPPASRDDARVEQLRGLQRRSHANARVEKRGLIQDLTHWLGVVRRGAREDLDPVTAQLVDGRLEVCPAVTEVRAEPEVADPAAGGHRRMR
jgi:hypothetical protein